MRTFPFVEMFQFVEMQSTFFYIFRTDWIFKMEFRSCDSSFNRKILRLLYLKFRPSAHAHTAVTYHFVLFTEVV